MIDELKSMFNIGSDNTVKTLLKHLEELKEKAVQSQPIKDYEKFENYYSGTDPKNNKASFNPYNIIKGIIDTKATLILDSQMVSEVSPKLKTFVDENELLIQNDIADILNDINAHVLDQNNFDKIKSNVVKNCLIYKVGITETVWNQGEDNKLGDIKIKTINPKNFYPDMSANSIQECNYIFIKESYSPITLKKKYPEYAKKMKETGSQEQGKPLESKGQPTAVNTLGNDYNTTQAYAYSNNSYKMSNSKNIVVWKCYLKDDSTFISKEDEDKREAELAFQYPNGRLIVFVDGAKDYLLEDKPIDYPFGFPIDLYTNATDTLLGTSEIQYLIDVQDRINRAYDKIRTLVAGFGSWLMVGDGAELTGEDFVNQLVINISDPNAVDVLTNNTLSELTTLLSYIDKLKQFAYEIARVNPMLISGERPSGVNSGDMVEDLNESPMSSIREFQRNFRYWICEQGQKNISLIQLFYNTPRMIRLTKSKQIAELPTILDQNDPEIAMQIENGTLQQENIRILEQKKEQNPENGEEEVYYEAIREIKGDLSIGEYDIQVVAGTEMPRSRESQARITQQLYAQGIFGAPNSSEAVEILLTALDYPHRHKIIQQIQEKEQQMSQPMEPPTDKISVSFKDLPVPAQIEWLSKHGFEQSAQQMTQIPPLNETGLPPEVIQ